MLQFLVVLMGGSPCEVGPLQLQRELQRAGWALTEFIGKVWKKTIPVVNVAARKDAGQLTESDFELLVEEILKSGLNQVMIPTALLAILPLARFLAQRPELRQVKIVLWTTRKYFSNNKKTGPMAIGGASVALQLMAPGQILAIYRDQVFDPATHTYDSTKDEFVLREESQMEVTNS